MKPVIPIISSYSIVIPCKNEEENIGNILNAIFEQTAYQPRVPIYIADAGSTDSTLEVISNFKEAKGMNIQVVSGGYPAVGRNIGASYVTTPYIIFLDADILPCDSYFIEKVIHKAINEQLDCVSAYIRPSKGDIRDKLFWKCHDIALNLYPIFGPFSAGMFMCFKTSKFWELGGFNEQIILGEDFDLSHQIDKDKFGIAATFIYTDNRRFLKTGYINTMVMYTKVAFSKNYRLADHREYFEKV